jgi:hypothetical protein
MVTIKIIFSFMDVKNKPFLKIISICFLLGTQEPTPTQFTHEIKKSDESL